jgi:hypothetical protein
LPRYKLGVGAQGDGGIERVTWPDTEPCSGGIACDHGAALIIVRDCERLAIGCGAFRRVKSRNGCAQRQVVEMQAEPDRTSLAPSRCFVFWNNGRDEADNGAAPWGRYGLDKRQR